MVRRWWHEFLVVSRSCDPHRVPLAYSAISPTIPDETKSNVQHESNHDGDLAPLTPNAFLPHPPQETTDGPKEPHGRAEDNIVQRTGLTVVVASTEA